MSSTSGLAICVSKWTSREPTGRLVYSGRVMLSTGGFVETSEGSVLRTAAPPWVKASLSATVVLIATLSCLGLIIAPRFFQPAEDAAILFQNADNFARTGIISYIE